MIKLFRSFTGAVLVVVLMVIVACENKPIIENVAEQAENEEQAAVTENTEEAQVIVFFGNSLTAGYGLEPEEAFPAIIQTYIDSLGYNYRVVNAGVSGETTASGNSRVDWILKQTLDVFVLELGGNDGLRGIDPAQTKLNL
jgi:acyl-CoA thioesterase-1